MNLREQFFFLLFLHLSLVFSTEQKFVCCYYSPALSNVKHFQTHCDTGTFYHNFNDADRDAGKFLDGFFVLEKGFSLNPLRQ